MWISVYTGHSNQKNHKIASKEMHGEKKGTLCCTIEGRRDKVTWNLVAFKILLVIDMKRSCMEIDLLSLFCFVFYIFFPINIFLISILNILLTFRHLVGIT